MTERLLAEENYEKYKYDIFSLLVTIQDLSDKSINECKACEKIEKLNLPLAILEAAMQGAIDHEYLQIYLTLLKKKEQKYGFIQRNKERFML